MPPGGQPERHLARRRAPPSGASAPALPGPYLLSRDPQRHHRHPQAEDLAEVVTVTGEIDIATYGYLRTELIKAVDEGPGTVVVDMSGVEWIDSTGLGTLVGALKRAREKHGTVQVAGAPRRIAKHFQVTGLSKVFSMHPAVEAALAVTADAQATP